MSRLLGLAHPWFPLYLLGMIGATLTPFRLGECAPAPWRFELSELDFAANLLLFLPFGLALARARIRWVIALAALFSFAVEVTQTWVTRHPSGADVLANAAGAWMGAVMAQRGTAWRWPVRWEWWLPMAAASLLALTLLARATRLANDFSNWEPMPLAIGNEATGDRPWLGTLSEIAIYDRARYGTETSPPPAWQAGGPVLWLSFGEEALGRTDGPEGPEPFSLQRHTGSGLEFTPEGLRSSAGTPLVPPEHAERLRRQVSASGRLTVTARIRPDSLHLVGPARIVSFSRDPFARDFTLAQKGSDLELRVRTPATGPDGTPPLVQTSDAPLTKGEHRVRAIYDGSDCLIYVDGRCSGRSGSGRTSRDSTRPPSPSDAQRSLLRFPRSASARHRPTRPPCKPRSPRG